MASVVPLGGNKGMKDLRVLIFSATYGAGHVRAAEAISEAMHASMPGIEIIHLDFGEFLGKTINKVIKNTYIEVIKHTPKLWGKFYYRTAKIPPHSVFQRFLNGLGRREFLQYIHSVRPDLIVCTYPTVAGVLSELRLRNVLDIPLVTVVTDYAVHSQWIHPGVDLYIVGCTDVADGLMKRGIDRAKIQVTGIPVHPRFEKIFDRNRLRAGLKLKPEVPTVLVMGGAYGVLGGAKRLCKFLADYPGQVQSLVVCGQDDRLYKSLETVVQGAKNTMVRFRFVTNVEELMSASDIVVSKAGGLTVSEALTKRLPILVLKPIPGQEEENAAFLERVGAGRIAETEEELEWILQELLANLTELEEMRRAAANVLPGRAAERAVQYMLGLTKTGQENQKIG